MPCERCSALEQALRKIADISPFTHQDPSDAANEASYIAREALRRATPPEAKPPLGHSFVGSLDATGCCAKPDGWNFCGQPEDAH